MKIDIKELVGKDKKVHFVSYREGEFIYKTDCGFEFPIPTDDLGKATLLAEDKAILFLRYIRKQVKLLELGNEPKSTSLDNFSSVIDYSEKDSTTEGTLKSFNQLLNGMKENEIPIRI